MQDARVVILAGGKGTRLRPYTTTIPKPLMPVGDRPILDIVLRQLRRQGFGRVTIATGHLAELIEAYCGDGERYGLSIDYFREEEALGTAGALGLIEGLRERSFLVMNGDVLTDLDFAALHREHLAGDADVTIATHRQDVQVSLGVMEFDDADDARSVTGYVEKPTISYEASMGVYCFRPSALESVRPGEVLDFPDLILRLIEGGRTVRGIRSDDTFWLDIGRPDDFERAQEEFESRRDQFLPDLS